MSNRPRHTMSRKSPVGLSPVPCFTDLRRQPSSTQPGVFCNELAQEDDVLLRNDSATIVVRDRHMWPVCQNPIWNASGLCFAQALTRRHSGAASPSGLPAAMSNCAWCARSTRAGSSPVGHQRKRPFDKRLVASQNPWPS